MNDKSLRLGFALFDDGRYAEALVQFKLAFKKLPNDDGGDEAALMIGKIYLYGLREKSDPAQAVTWLNKTAGLRYDPTQDVPVFDPRRPERNTPIGEANVILADIYCKGHGPIAKDVGRCIRYLERAVEVGHLASAKPLGDLYYEGVDVPRDLKAAFSHYMKGALFAYVPTMTAVARMYEMGEVGDGPNPVKALAWRNQAARDNDPDSLYLLARAYDRGDGVEGDTERALSLYKLAAMNGQPAAMTAMGTYFYNGEGGMSQDRVIARRWFEEAALSADPDGMFNLAAMMANGEGGEQDRVRAWGWFSIARRAGHPNAAAAAQAIEVGMTPQERASMTQMRGLLAG